VDAGAFRRAWLGGCTLPHPLGGGWRLDAVVPGGPPNSVGLVLARDAGDPVQVFVSPSRPDAPKYTQTRFLDIGYHPPPADVPPGVLESLLASIRGLLEKGEKRLGPAAVSAAFPEA